ncbi:hypothetical protein FRX31_032030 [Thalictrum thalictroides]|uniref:S-protein homolog n=1 Tax=Thalictrum thalictroides TaxID=46969 RepID=A0A7J6V107_THATH|nr:hypothetical protein FRX31_032030 [Thalictrum thalictroides]
MGNDFNKNKVINGTLLLLLFLSWEFSLVSGIKWHMENTVVIIRNLLSEKTTKDTVLYLHCKSADDDLGPKVLGYNDEFSWRFAINFWETTMFWCNMSWVDTDGREVHGSFNVYKASRDYKKSGMGRITTRNVRNDGIYDDVTSTLMFKWPPKE